MDNFYPGEKVIVEDHAMNRQEVIAEVDGTWAIEDANRNTITRYRVWVIMPDRTLRVYDKHEVKHIDTKEG